MAEEDAAEVPPQEQLFVAAEKGDVAAMKALLLSRDELGIDINAKGEDGMTALNRAISEGYLGEYITVLMFKVAATSLKLEIRLYTLTRLTRTHDLVPK